MPNCTQKDFGFPSFDRRKIEANFAGGDVSSDGGLLLLREADRRLGLLKALDAVLPDPRDPLHITHRQIDLLRQRVYGIAQGYEDLNDHETLRHDLVWQTAEEAEGTREAEGRASRWSGRPRWPAIRRFAGSSSGPIGGRRSLFTGCCWTISSPPLPSRPRS